MSKKNFIKLPSIRSIKVNNYTLFRDSWSYNVKNGLNLFLGINGLGKTTAANMIIYGLVGICDEITPKYFKSRKRTDEDNKPTVALSFNVGSEKLFIERKLFAPEVVSFKIGENEYSSTKSGSLDEFYIDKLLELTGINDLKDLSFMLHNLMIREEEGNFLLWDQDAQSRVIRLLLNYPKFDFEFRRLSNEVIKADSKVRDTQYRQSQLRADKWAIIKLKNENIKQDSAYKSISEVENAIKSVEETIKKLRGSKKEAFENIKYTTKNLNDIESEIEKLSADVDYLSDEINALEEELFGSIYASPKVALATHKLTNYKICMFCNTNITSQEVIRITDIIEKHKHCPVCDSNLIRPTVNAAYSTKMVYKLEQLKSECSDKNKDVSLLEDKKQHLSSESAVLWDKQTAIDVALKQALLENEELRLKRYSLSEGKEDLSLVYDRDIKVLEERIKAHDTTVRRAQKDLSKHSNELKKMNDELNEIIVSFEEHLNAIFNKYVSDYFRGDCTLQPYTGKKSKDARVKLTTFVPKYGGQKRLTKDSVSTSERIFLESLFRLSLMELYHRFTSTLPFIVLETTEGVFDIHMTIKFAKALTEFSKNKFPFIAITNLSKPDFIKSLISNYNKPENRTLKFLDFGALTEEQQDNIQELQKVQEDIFAR